LAAILWQARCQPHRAQSKSLKRSELRASLWRPDRRMNAEFGLAPELHTYGMPPRTYGHHGHASATFIALTLILG